MAGPLIFCAQDAGGARNLAPVAALAASRGLTVRVIGSATTAPLFTEAGLAVEAAPANETEAAIWLAGLHPAAILAGTARYAGIEAWLTRAAASLGVRSLAVMDEWYGYRSRFCGTDGTFQHLPDLVCCPDAMAFQEAQAEGLPPEIIRVTGSPALAAHAARIEAFAAAPPPRPAILGPASAISILFLSETHAADYGTAVGSPGSFGPFLGYTELSVRQDLATALTPFGPRVHVVEKLHPSERTPPPMPAGMTGQWDTTADAALWPLLWHAHVVIGMRSMALLEAALMGHRPAAYQPDLAQTNCCTAARLDLADDLRDPAALAVWLGSALSAPVRTLPRRFPFCAAGAAAAILDIALAP